MAKKDLNDYIKRSHLKAVEKFNTELEAFATETGDAEATLYEDPFTSFTLSHVHVMEGCLCYTYDGTDDHETVVVKDPETKEYYEVEFDGIMDYIHFWRKCLNRARKFWSMDPDHLDAIQNTEAEYHEEEED